MDEEIQEEIDLKEREKRIRLRQEKEDLKLLLSHIEARKYFWKVLSECSVFSSTYNPDHSKMSFQEGMRAVGLNIMSQIIEASPEDWAKMQKEASK